MAEAGQALTEAAVQAGLAGLRLPAGAPGGAVAELAVGAGLGLALGLILAVALRPVLRRRPRAAPPASLAQRLAAAEALPGPERELALLRLWREVDPAAYAARRAGLYTPGGMPEALSDEVAEAMAARVRADA